jgi:hypothetical protein
MTKSVRAPARPVVLIFFFFFKVLLAWWPSLLVLRRHRSYALEHRDPSWIMLSRSTLRAIVDGRHSAHTGIAAVLEERAMPVITWIFTSLQTLPSTALIFLIFWFVLATLPLLVFIFLE